MMEKSSKFLWELMIRVDSEIVKRVVSVQYMRSVYGMTFEEGRLPGKAGEGEEEIKEAVSCVESMLHR